MKKFLIVTVLAGAAWALRGLALRAEEERRRAEEEATREIDTGDTRLFVNPSDMFTEGH